ncbi:MAG: diguanylate cyclase domain-containing protein [Oceanococcus sp.]
MFRSADVDDRIAEMQSVLVNRIWAGLAILSLIGVPLSLSRAASTGWLPMYAVHIAVGLTALGVFGLRHRLSSRLKAGLIIVLFWLIGAMGLITLGLLGAGTWWLVTSALLVSTLYSARAGIITIAGVCVAVSLTGFGFNSGVLSISFDANSYMTQPSSWATLIIATVVLPLVVFSAINELNSTMLSLTHDVERQREEIAMLAITDELTGIPRQSIALDRLQQALSGVQRSGSKVAVLFIDLDGFKAVNDEHGHAAGDEVLRAMSKRWRASLRPSDTLARKGGDEFIVVLVGVPVAEIALKIARKLVAAAQAPIAYQGVLLQVGCSIGVAVSPEHAQHADSLINKADIAMYAAKQAGKNQALLAESAPLKLISCRSA